VLALVKPALPGKAAMLVWTAATVLSVPIVFLLTFGLPTLVLGTPMDDGPWAMPVLAMIGAIGGAITGLLIGWIQGRVLPRHVPWAEKWARATAIGWALCGAISLPLYWTIQRDAGWTADGLEAVVLGSIGIGLVQYLLLRASLKRAAWWPVATILGWTLGLLLARLVVWGIPAVLGREQDWFLWPLLPLLYGGPPGIVTGWLLSMWMRHGDAPAH
jgi:hypothetical protein